LFPCGKVLRNVKEFCEYEKIFRRQNSATVSRRLSPALVLDVCAGDCQKALLKESGMIKIQVRMHNRSEMVVVEAVHVSLVRILMAVFDISHELEGYLLF
jgi:hypothetical protein